MESNKIVTSTFAQLAKLYGTLTAEDVEAIAAGAAKIVVVAQGQKIAFLEPGQMVVDKSPMVELALKAARAVKPSDVERATAGGSSFKIVHARGKVIYPIDFAEVAEQASQQGSEAAIVKFLSGDERLKLADLKKVADTLGIALPSTAKKADQVIAHIARSLAAFGS